ncbi:hypothetical protein P7K49_029059 [Saguinus oedipus]|uniref:Activator of Hsp90 ATPase AHSA1-like N-terminal domain-containing protein n=1 Tax=Saguinus oedipus TaxID=9490 RepID=A0ABQ9U647_SAGOE|nr:hypothetical protein P7K49_029059 [Saguinus oedipus]
MRSGAGGAPLPPPLSDLLPAPPASPPCVPASLSPRKPPPLRHGPGLPGSPRRGGAERGRGRGLLAVSGRCERAAPGLGGRKRGLLGRRRPGLFFLRSGCAARAAMAKWGQGDPRWIVEEREDGTNVNNWHWCGRRPPSGVSGGRGLRWGLCGARGARLLSAAGRGARPPPPGSGASLSRETGGDSCAGPGGSSFLFLKVGLGRAPPRAGPSVSATSSPSFARLTWCVGRGRLPYTAESPEVMSSALRLWPGLWSLQAVKGKLQEFLVGIVVENEAGRGEISELKQVEGEASCSSRKGKLIFFYEWNIKLGWKGYSFIMLCPGKKIPCDKKRNTPQDSGLLTPNALSLAMACLTFLLWLLPTDGGPGVVEPCEESGVKHKGLIEIPNLSEENEVDDTEVNVSKKKGDGDILKDLMKTAGAAKVREALGDYLKALKTEFTMGMILPTKAMATQELTGKRKLSENTLQVQASSPVALGVRIPTVALHMMELFDTTVEQLYSIFTVKDLVQKFSKSAVLEAEKGGKFQMFDGNITGEYLELVPIFLLKHYATVALNFVPTLGQTELQLDCKGVPVCKEENMKFCWQKQHFEEIKGLLQLTPLNH